MSKFSVIVLCTDCTFPLLNKTIKQPCSTTGWRYPNLILFTIIYVFTHVQVMVHYYYPYIQINQFVYNPLLFCAGLLLIRPLQLVFHNIGAVGNDITCYTKLEIRLLLLHPTTIPSRQHRDTYLTSTRRCCHCGSVMQQIYFPECLTFRQVVFDKY